MKVRLWHEPWKASVTRPHQIHSTPASHSTICPRSWQKRHRQPLDTVRGWENWCRVRRCHIPHTKLQQHRFTIYMEAITRFSSLRWAEYSFWERQIMSRLLSFYSLRAERQREYRQALKYKDLMLRFHALLGGACSRWMSRDAPSSWFKSNTAADYRTLSSSHSWIWGPMRRTPASKYSCVINSWCGE